VSVGWASQPSRGMCGGDALLLSHPLQASET
jgi:Leucine-rich repeat (LRR) protein